MWQEIWSDPTVVGGAIAGFFSALLMWLVGDVFWKTHLENNRARKSLQQRQLEQLYGPIYSYYQEAYLRFDRWKQDNPYSQLDRQPLFFNQKPEEEFVHRLFGNHSGLATPSTLRFWNELKASDKTDYENAARSRFVANIVDEYFRLGKELRIVSESDEQEARTFWQASR